MSPDRNISISFGILLIASLVFGISSSVPALEASDYLVRLSSIRVQVTMAVFSQCAMAIAYTCIATLIYPIVRRYSERAAIGYFGFRIIGATFLFAGVVPLLSLLFISERFISAGQPDSSPFQTIGELLRVTRDWCNHVGMILPWSLGGLILNVALYKTNLIPKWLSIWGILGSSLTLIATLLLIADAIRIVTTTYLVLNAPTGLFEIALAIFLLAKGFNPFDVQSKVE